METNDDLRSAEEIRNLLVRYGLYLDNKDFEGYVSLFTRDGVLDAPLGSATGPENIRAMLGNVLGPINAGFHIYANPLIEVDGEDATAMSRFSYVQAIEGQLPELRLVGHYDDTLRREDGRWKFARRKITIDAGRPPYRD
ncbi:MAG: nuclear transport factor 2 family protein [Ilumatobacteraceae bacterium]